LEERIRLVAGAGQVVGRGAQVVDATDLKAMRDADKAVEPDSSTAVFLVGVLSFSLLVIFSRKVAVVGFVVDDQ